MSSFEDKTDQQLVALAAALIDEIEKLVAQGRATTDKDETVHILNQALLKQGEVAQIQAEVHRRFDERH